MSTTTTKETFRLNRTEFERQVRLGSEGNGEGIHTLLTLECVDSDTIDRLLRDCCEKKILVSDGDREIRVLSTNLEYGDTIAVLIASYVGFAEFTHTVASMLYGLTDLVGKELWNLADQDTERTWAVLEAVTHIANQVPEQLKESEACLERKIRRRQEGVWKVTNHVPGEVPTVSEFTDYEEAAAECESLTIQIESDRAIDDQAHGVFDQAAVTGRVVDAIRRLERFRRGETREWQLDQVDDQPTVTLEYIASGADCEVNDGNGFILDKTALVAAIAREKSGMIVNVISPLTTTSWDHESPDSIAHLVGQAIEAGAITGPGSAEIVIYPISLEDPGVCQVTIWTGNIKGYAHVIAGQPSLRDLAPESTWRTGGEITLTTTVLERIIEIANTALEDATVLVERKREQAVTGH